MAATAVPLPYAPAADEPRALLVGPLVEKLAFELAEGGSSKWASRRPPHRLGQQLDALNRLIIGLALGSPDIDARWRAADRATQRGVAVFELLPGAAATPMPSGPAWQPFQLTYYHCAWLQIAALELATQVAFGGTAAEAASLDYLAALRAHLARMVELIHADDREAIGAARADEERLLSALLAIQGAAEPMMNAGLAAYFGPRQ